MRESLDLSRPDDEPEPAFVQGLRAVRPLNPRLDRDRLMFLAGRRSAAATRRPGLWPMTAAVSWASSFALIGWVLARSPEVVVKTRVVEKVVQVPVEIVKVGPTRSERPTFPAPGVATPRASGTEWSPAGVGNETWTLFSSRSAVVDDLASAVAEVDPAGPSVAPSEVLPPVSYAEMRRELLPVGPSTSRAAGMLHWF